MHGSKCPGSNRNRPVTCLIPIDNRFYHLCKMGVFCSVCHFSRLEPCIMSAVTGPSPPPPPPALPPQSPGGSSLLDEGKWRLQKTNTKTLCLCIYRREEQGMQQDVKVPETRLYKGNKKYVVYFLQRTWSPSCRGECCLSQRNW